MLDIHPSEGSTLSYQDSTRCLAPIPFSERDLPTAIAEPYFKVGDSTVALEGPAFDRQGNLLFVDIYGGRVLRLSPSRQLTTLYTEPDLHPAGIAIHRDGRMATCTQIGCGIGRRGSTGPVQRKHLVRSRRRQKHKAIATDPGHLRFADTQQDGTGDGCIDSVAACFQHLHGNLGRQRVRRGAHAVFGKGRRSTGFLKIAHLVSLL